MVLNVKIKKNSPIRGWGGLSKMSKKSPKCPIIEIISIRSYLFDFSDLKCLQTKLNYINKLKLYEISHLTWLHPFTHTPTNRWGCLNISKIFKQNWIISIRSRFIRYLAIWPDPIHWPTEPPIHTTIHAPTHGWGCLFEIINLQTELNYLDYVKIY